MRGLMKLHDLDSSACPCTGTLFLPEPWDTAQDRQAVFISPLPSAWREKGQTERERGHRCLLCSFLLCHPFERKLLTNGEVMWVRGDTVACPAICCVYNIAVVFPRCRQLLNQMEAWPWGRWLLYLLIMGGTCSLGLPVPQNSHTSACPL